MLKFYFNMSPNPIKVALYLEESGLPYEAHPVDARQGHQHKPDYRAINPNGKVPAIVDGDATVFDSNAILLYLGEKTGKFMPTDKSDKTRGEFLSWLMFIASGVGPFSGQAVHFRHFAPEKVPYATNRYAFEADRHYTILEERLGHHAYMMGAEYGILDMALFAWTRMIPFIMGEGAWEKFPNLKRHHDAINARPAVARVMALKDKHAWKAEMDDEARKNMFLHLERQVAA